MHNPDFTLPTNHTMYQPLTVPTEPERLRALGAVLGALGRPGEAASALRDCLHLTGPAVQDCMDLACLYRRQHMYEKAVRQLQAAVRLLNDMGPRAARALPFHPNEGACACVCMRVRACW